MEVVVTQATCRKSIDIWSINQAPKGTDLGQACVAKQ